MSMTTWRRRTVPLLLGLVLASGLALFPPKPPPAKANMCEVPGTPATGCVDLINEDPWVATVSQMAGIVVDIVNLAKQGAEAAVQNEVQQCQADCVAYLNHWIATAGGLPALVYSLCNPGAVIVGWPTCAQYINNLNPQLGQVIDTLIHAPADPALVQSLLTAVGQLAGTVTTLVNQTVLPIVNPVVGQVTAIANDPLGTAQPAMSLVASTVATVQQIAGGLNPTIDQTIVTAMQTANSTLGTLQSAIAYIASQVPDPNSTAAQVVALAYGQLPTVMQAAQEVQAIAFAQSGLGSADGDTNTGDSSVPKGAPSTDPNYYIAAAKRLVAATQYEPYVAFAMAKYSSEATEPAPMPYHCSITPTPPPAPLAPTAAPTSTQSDTGQCPVDAPMMSPNPKFTSYPSNELTSHPTYLQSKDYTCAPSSAREVLEYYTHTDFGEMQLAGEMKTTQEGSYWVDVVNVMSNKSTIKYVGEKITGPDKLMTRVVYDVNGGSEPAHGTVLNVNQSHLGYWRRNPADPKYANNKHYLVASGYGFRSAGRLILIDGGNSTVLGRHVVDLAEAYKAVQMNKSLIIW